MVSFLPGCGGGSPSTPPPAGTSTTVRAQRGVVVQTGSPEDAGMVSRLAGRRWRSCALTVINEDTGFDYEFIGRSGRASCDDAKVAFVALARAVGRSQDRRARRQEEDCFPGFCGDTMDADGWRCTVGANYSDVSTAFEVICRRGKRFAEAYVADDE